jgi:amino acid transporter
MANYASEDERIRELGVEPVFKRVLGLASVAFLAIAFQGPTAAAFTVAIAMVPIMGPSLIWTIPVILVFQMVLAVVWAELCSHYPLTGGIYQWARYLGGEAAGFFAGLMYLTALLILMSALGFGMTAIVNGLIPSVAATTTNQVIITVLLSASVAALCAMPIRVVSRVNSIGVVVELVVLTAFTLIFLFNTRQPLHELTSTAGTTHGGSSYLSAFFIGAALMVGVLTGSETAGIFAEDSKQSRVAPGRAITIACFSVAFFTGLLFFALVLATPNFHAAIDNPAAWVTQALQSAVGKTGSKIFLVGAGIAVFSTTVATLMASSKMMFGLARDRQLPAERWLTRTSTRTEQPTIAIVVCAVLGLLPLLAAKKIPVLVSAFTGMLVLPYVITLGALIVRRAKGWPHERAPVSLGRWAWPLTLIGFAYAVALTIDLFAKRPQTNPNLGSYPVLWEFIVVFAVVGGAWWYLVLRRRGDEPVDLAPEQPPTAIEKAAAPKI